jgi:hypothetical protein
VRLPLSALKLAASFPGSYSLFARLGTLVQDRSRSRTRRVTAIARIALTVSPRDGQVRSDPNPWVEAGARVSVGVAVEPGHTFGEWVDTLGKKIQATSGPVCIHEICRLADQDPTNLGVEIVVLGFVDLMRRSRWGSPPKIGGAGVGLKGTGLFAKIPCDYFYWSLAGGVPSTPDGLATFGPEWRGESLAMKVRLHVETFPPLYGRRGRGPPMPDITF